MSSNVENQQRTVQAPGGFTDTKVAGNAPRSGGLERELRNFNGENIYMEKTGNPAPFLEMEGIYKSFAVTV